MASWSEFTAAEPQLASAIRALLLQYGPGMGYLATVRADGGPRVHPVSPVVTDEGLYCFVVDSAKRRDLERDGRYALHSYPPEEADDEAYVTGHAHPVTDQAVITRLADALNASPAVDWRLFELTVETAMLRRHGPAGALPLALSLRYPPITLTWRDPSTTTAKAATPAPAPSPAPPAPPPAAPSPTTPATAPPPPAPPRATPSTPTRRPEERRDPDRPHPQPTRTITLELVTTAPRT